MRKTIPGNDERRTDRSRWSLVVAGETDRSVRSYLARTGGKKGDLSRFVERAVRQAIFWETLDSIWERNTHLRAVEVQNPDFGGFGTEVIDYRELAP